MFSITSEKHSLLSEIATYKLSYLKCLSIRLRGISGNQYLEIRMTRYCCRKSIFGLISVAKNSSGSSKHQRLVCAVSSVNELAYRCRGWSSSFIIPASQHYSSVREKYDLFGDRKPGDQHFRKVLEAQKDEDHLWTGSDNDDDNDDDTKQVNDANLSKELKRVKKEAEENASLIDADDSDELRSVWSGSDEEKTLWTGSEQDDDDDIPTEAHPNERSDPYIDKIFEFEDTPKYRTISDVLKAEKEEDLSPGKQARKLAVENALKKLKKGPDGRYTNVWEVMSDVDILIGAFENIVSGPEYKDLREGGPKRLNMQFFKDIQAKMRDPNFKFSPELKLKPKRKLVPRKKYQKVQSRIRKDMRR